MIGRKIQVRIEDQTPRKVTIRFLNSNGKMFVPKSEFERRVEEGLYEVVE